MENLEIKKILKSLTEISKSIRPNNPKIKGDIINYIDNCLSNKKIINILTPWSLSKAFEKRFIQQGNCFIPTEKETRLFDEEIPKIAKVLKDNGLEINWIIFLSRAYLENRLLQQEIETAYRVMITNLVKNCSVKELIILDWEDDVLKKRSFPSQKVMDNFFDYVKKGAFEYDFKRWKQWIINEGRSFSDEQLIEETKYQIACEAKEAELLVSKDSPFGFSDFIFIPLGVIEKYNFFSTLVKSFKNKIIPVLTPYPWRI